MPQTIENIDRFFLYVFNGSDSMFIDELALLLTNGFTWIPLYVALIVLVIKNNEKFSQVVLLIGAVAFALVLSYGMADIIVKPSVARLRPVCDPSLKGVVTVVNGYYPSSYSFSLPMLPILWPWHCSCPLLCATESFPCSWLSGL